MPEETTTSDTQSETQNVSGPKSETLTTSGSSETQETTTSNDDLQERFRRMEAALKKANSEAKTYRLESDELKKFREQIEAEKLSDTEKQTLAQQKLEKQLAEYQSQSSELLRQLQEERLNNEVIKQSTKLNIIDLDAAIKLIDSSRIDYDESRRPTNVDALLKELIKARPWLAGKAQSATSGGATNPSRAQTSGLQEITKEQAQRIMQSGRDEFNKLSQEEQLRVRKALNPGLFRK